MRIFLLTTGLVLVLVSSFIGSVASAETQGPQRWGTTHMTRSTPTPQADAGTDTEQPSPGHCIIGPKHAVQCFTTEAEALYVATGGEIQLAQGETARASLSDQELFSTAVQALLYEHTNYTGDTLTVYSDGCYGWNNMPSNWNDQVSSAWTGDCGITLFEDYNLTGPNLRIDPPGTSYVGDSMNDEASSWSLP